MRLSMKSIYLCILAAFLLFQALVVSAQGSIRADVFEKLEQAQLAQEEERIGDALKILDKLKARSGKKSLKPYELVQLHNFYAYAYIAQENYSKALASFETMLKQKDIPEGIALQTQMTMAQLYLATDKPDQAIAKLNQWLKQTKKPTPEAYVLMSQAYLQKQDIDQALPKLLKAFELAKKQQRTEKENWYALLQYIYNEKKDYRNQEKALEVLVNRWPKAQWWLALGGVYALQEKDEKQLYAMDAAYQQGLLTRGQYLVSLSQLLSMYGAPYYAAKTMQQGLDQGLIEPEFKNLQRLADYYQRAKEYDASLVAYKAAIEKAEDGETSLRLAYVYMNKYEYALASQYIETALQQGGLRNKTQAQLLLGESYYHQQRFDKAIKQFDQVLVANKNYQTPNQDDSKPQIDIKKKRYYEQAARWLKFSKNEKNRQVEIARWLKENA